MIKITNKSIDSVPMVQSDVLHKQYWNKLHQEHKDLLNLAIDKQLGTECARVFDLNMIKLGNDLVVEQGDNRVYVPNFDIPHIIIHNHADGATLSLEDFNSFMRRPNTLSIHAVSNGGSVCILEKLPHFNAAEAIKKYISTLNEAITLVENGAIQPELEIIVEQFLVSLVENGFMYRRWV